MDRILSDLLQQWEERRADSAPVTPEELCADRPDLLDEVRRWIRRLNQCNSLLTVGQSQTRDFEEGQGDDGVIPREIGGFQIRRRLGRGGMGIVYEGWDSSLRRAVAIKVLRHSFANRPFARTDETSRRFEREGQVLALLKHEFVVQVYGAGLWDGRPYIAMAFMPGGPLSKRSTELAQRGPRAVVAFIEKVARAVHAAHEHGVLHRDLKPSNILMDDHGNPCVSDFGLAKFWTTDDQQVEPNVTPGKCRQTDEDFTYPGLQPGTPAYMAPEQFDPALGRVGPATDIWALGIILYELLADERPFVGDSIARLGDKVCRETAATCRMKNRTVPRWLDAIVTRCLQKSPADRFPSAISLADALRDGLRPRRRLAYFAAVGVVMLVAVFGYFGGRGLSGSGQWPGPAQNQDLEPPFAELPEVVAALEQLKQGNEVILVDSTHHAPFRKVFGSETIRVRDAGQGELELSSRWTGPGIAEFLPWLPPGKYRIQALVRHDQGGDFSRVALYVGGQYWKSNVGEHISCIALEFADMSPQAVVPPMPGQSTNAIASLQCLLTGEVRTAREHWQSCTFGLVKFLTALAAKKPPEFRVLTLVVSVTDVTAFWEDATPVGSVSRQDAIEQRSRHLRGYPPQESSGRLTEPFEGGLGLMICSGKVSVKQLKVTPIE